MELLIFLFVIVIGVSFLCSILESILLSTNVSYISVIEKDNPTAGKLLITLIQDIDKSIASILILNTYIIVKTYFFQTKKLTYIILLMRLTL